MPSKDDLVITADHPSRMAEFPLHDAAGMQLASRQSDFKTISVGHQQGLFDLNHLACVPWEIATPKAGAETLGKRNLLVRVVHDVKAPASTPRLSLLSME